MEKEKIEILYKILMAGLKLTNDTLRVYGISEDDIDMLIGRRVIEPIKGGEYKLLSMEKFHRYGVNLMLEKNYALAHKCFETCYKLAPHSVNICLQVLLTAVKKHNYERAFEIFAVLEKIHPDKNRVNNDLYLYLLSMVTKCPEGYIDRAKKIGTEDLMLPYSVGVKVENNIRYAISQHKFKYAYQLTIDKMAKEGGYSVKFELIKGLLSQALGVDSKLKDNLLSLTFDEKYAEVVSLLRELQQQRALSKLEMSILLVADAIINISQNNVLPVSTIDTTDDMHEAILGNNYKLALSINEEHREFTRTDRVKDTINILLLKLNGLIQEVETKCADEQMKEQKEKQLSDIEEWAYFISSQNMTLEIARKQFGLLHEQMLLIKLVYARDYYIESNYSMGDKMLEEVVQDENKTEVVIAFLKEVRLNRDKYREQLKQYRRRLSLQ